MPFGSSSSSNRYHSCTPVSRSKDDEELYSDDELDDAMMDASLENNAMDVDFEIPAEDASDHDEEVRRHRKCTS